ncbi:hypothetical protein CR513_49000, partial [Mucuna pruriens]
LNYFEVVVYSNSNYVGYVDSRKSTFGYIFLLARGTKCHGIVENNVLPFTMEVEFTMCCKTILGLGIGNSIAKLLRIYCDNSIIVFLNNVKYSNGAKYMDLKYLLRKKSAIYSVN